MKYIGWLIGICLLAPAFGQHFGGNPAGTKWLQSENEKVRVIFPTGFEKLAARVINLTGLYGLHDITRPGNQLRKIDLVLQPQTTISNAYVGLAPWRSEFYTTAPMDPFELGAQSWLDNLVVHEFRHVQQYSNYRKGLSGWASLLLGQQGQALANAASVPDWFFEGDAIYAETRFSHQGRGRLPLFLSAFQSLDIAGKQYSYMRLRNGSLRSYSPNHYDLGYLLVSYGRLHYGDSIWNGIGADASSFRSLFYPFQHAFKKAVSISFDQFVSDAMNYYQTQWADAKKDSAHFLTPVPLNDVVDYRYPHLLTDGSLLVLRKSLQSVPGFYRIDPEGREVKLATRSIATEDQFSYQNGKIVYAAYQPDARWGNRNFNRINIIDLASGQEHSIISKSKYYTPDLSHDASTIVVVEQDPVKGASLVTLSTKGQSLSRISANGWVYAEPKFDPTDRYIYFTVRNEKGEMSLMKKAWNNADTALILLPFQNRLIGYLNVQGDTVLYTTTYRGRDETWALIDQPKNSRNFRLASYPTGLYRGVIRPDGRLVSSAFTADGYRLAVFDPMWQRAENNQPLTQLYTGSLYPSSDQSFLDRKDSSRVPTSSYPLTKGWMHVHSWRPMYNQPEYSVTWYGENTLNTIRTELAYTYNQNEASHKIGYTAIYGGSYIQPLLGISQTWSRSGYYRNDTTVHWNEPSAYFGVQLPFNFSGGRAFRLLNFSTTYHLDQVRWMGTAQKIFRDLDDQSLQSRMDYSSQIQQSTQQIFPRWGQRMSLQYKFQTGNGRAWQWLLSGSMYLPGLVSHHSLVIAGAFQSRDTLRQYSYSNNFPFSRGYAALDYPDMWKLAANYHFPICYPDWGFGNLVYFLRIRANLFYDLTRAKSRRTGITNDFASAGGELYFDTRWWNQQPVSLGIRYSHLLNPGSGNAMAPNVWEFILPVNLF